MTPQCCCCDHDMGSGSWCRAALVMGIFSLPALHLLCAVCAVGLQCEAEGFRGITFFLDRPGRSMEGWVWVRWWCLWDGVL